LAGLGVDRPAVIDAVVDPGEYDVQQGALARDREGS